MPAEHAEKPPSAPQAHDTPAEPEPDSDPWSEVAAAVPPVTAMDRLSASVPPSPRTTGLIAVWVMTFVTLTTAVAAVIVWRDPVVRAWPPIARIVGSVDHVTQNPTPDVGKSPEPSRPAKE